MATLKNSETNTETVQIQTKKGSHKPNINVIIESEEAFKHQFSGFFGFLRERAVVGLAVGFVVATQVQGVVKQFIDGFINPAFTLWFGGEQLNKREFVVHLHGRTGKFGWGGVVYALVDFLFVVAIIYLLIKLFKLDKFDKKKDS